MLATGSLLAQVGFDTADQIDTVFTASTVTEVTYINICNFTGSSVEFSLYHDDDGSTYDNSTALEIGTSIAANSTVKIQAPSEGTGILIARNGTLGASADTADALTVSIYGVSAKETGYNG